MTHAAGRLRVSQCPQLSVLRRHQAVLLQVMRSIHSRPEQLSAVFFRGQISTVLSGFQENVFRAKSEGRNSYALSISSQNKKLSPVSRHCLMISFILFTPCSGGDRHLRLLRPVPACRPPRPRHDPAGRSPFLTRAPFGRVASCILQRVATMFIYCNYEEESPTSG